MTITQSKFYGGYKKVTVDGTYRLSALHPRFIRFICMHHEDSIYLPHASELPIHAGGASFTLWNEGYHNCIVRNYNGIEVGCIQGDGNPSHDKCWTNIHLVKADKSQGTWWVGCPECVDPPDLTFTESWSVTVSESWSDSQSHSNSSDSGHGDTTGYSHTFVLRDPNHEPFQFPLHPEIPIPQRRPKRAAEGI